MKAVLSFIEWHLQSENDYICKIDEVANFYNQPFDVGMLVNPFPPDEEAGVHYIMTDWHKAESLRLFDGWVKVDKGSGLFRCGQAEVYKLENEFHFTYYPKVKSTFITLNDFITLCKLAGIELQWNENNETIKNLFN